MKCPSCNAEVSSEMTFCTICGAKLSNVQEEQPTAPVTPPVQNAQPTAPVTPPPQNMNYQPPMQNQMNYIQPMSRCKRCNAEFPANLNKCPICGKNAKSGGKGSIVWIVILSLLVVALATVLVLLYMDYARADDVFEELTSQIADRDTKISALENEKRDALDENDRLNRRIDSLEDQIDGSGSEYNKVVNELNDLKVLYNDALAKNRFYDTYIVFYLEDGTNLFHKYGCPYMDGVGNRFYAYNKNAAYGQGYEPCHICVK